MPTWTAAQQEAICARGSNLLISAAAGSGKTAVLVQRIVSLVEEGSDIERMLVVTFTRAAAGEMKSRIAASLMKSAGKNERMLAQSAAAERASISTLHSFCIDVLRSYFQVTGIDPAFRIAQGAQASLLRGAALEEVLDAFYEQADEDFLELDARYGPYESISALASQLYDFILSKPDPWGFLSWAVSLYEGNGFALWKQEVAQNIALKLEDAKDLLLQMYKVCTREPALEKYLFTHSEDTLLIQSLLDAGNQSMDALMHLLPVKFSTLKRITGDVEGQSEFKALRVSLKKSIDKMGKNLSLLQEEKEGPALRPAMGALARLIIAWDETFASRKAAEGVLTFSDLEQLALLTLQDPAVAASMRARFDTVFVDEYQDISAVQEAILRCVSGDNQFLVGDVKQSIYRFRLAEPTLFLRKYEAWQTTGGRVIDLSKNFRSRENILRFVNALFGRIMTPQSGEIAYDEAARLQPGGDFQGEDPPIELHFIHTKDETPSEEDEDELTAGELLQVEKEARLIAKRIHALRGQSFYDHKQQRMRPYAYRDIVVLMRNARNTAAILTQELLEQGIAAYADVGEGFFAVLEVRTLLDLLRVLDNPKQDLPLLGALRGIAGFSAHDLASIRVPFKQGHFYEAAEAFCLLENDCAQRLRTFYEQLDTWRALSQRLPVAELIEELLARSGYEDFVRALPGGASRISNLRDLVTRAIEFDTTQGGALCDFVALIEKLRKGGDGLAALSLAQGDDVVRVMTIHKSKGLEFPVVFVAQLGKTFSGRTEELYMHSELGIAPYRYEPTLNAKYTTWAREALLFRNRRESIAEEMRVLYVALTRAQDRLILISSLDISKLTQYAAKWARPASPTSALNAGGFMDWIGTLVAQPLLDEQTEFLSLVEGAAIHVKTHTIFAAQKQLSAQKQEADDIPEWLQRRLSWQYPHPQDQPPLKLTVTQLARHLPFAVIQEDGEEAAPEALPYAVEAAPQQLSSRPKFMQEQGLTPAQKGSATHAALLLLPLTIQDEPQITDAIAAMVSNGQLTQEEGAAVDTRALLRFLKSELASRMRKAKTLKREQPFNLRMRANEVFPDAPPESILLQGIIDCCFIEDDAWILVDYKTDRRNAHEIKELYTAQLKLYALALARLTEKPVRQTLLVALQSGTIVEID